MYLVEQSLFEAELMKQKIHLLWAMKRETLWRNLTSRPHVSAVAAE